MQEHTLKSHPGKIRQGLFTAGAVFVCLAALVTPLSTSLLGLFSILSFLAWLLAGGLTQLPPIFKTNRSTAAALLLFSFMVVAIFYSPAEPSEALSVLKKYRELIMLPIVFSLLSISPKYRTLAINCFLTGCIILMTLSYLMFFDLFAAERYGYSLVYHITHSFFMAVLAFWALHYSLEPGIKRYIWGFVFAAAVINIIYIAPGRTGMFVFCCLMLLFLFQRLSLLKCIVSLIVFSLFLGGAYYTSENVSGRIHEAVEEMQNYEPGKSRTSVGQRFDWWNVSIDLIKQKPIAGHGTGSYRLVHRRSIENTKITPTDNPHNEYLFLGVQFGLIGLILFFAMIALQTLEAQKVSATYRYLFHGVLLALLAGSLMNSLLFDSQQGHSYLFMSAALLAGTD